MTILSDHPAHERDGDLDQIGFKPRLAAVLDILRHKHTHCPVTIAIYGDWGTGKSSAMRWLAAQLTAWNSSEADRKGHPCVYPVWFDPWKYHQREEVWRGIIAEVILAVFDVKNLTVQNALERLPAASKNLLTWLGRSAARIVGGTKVKAGAAGAEVTVPAQTIVEDFHNTNHPEDAYLNSFEKDLREWVEQFLGKDSRLCLFIDDLDRCLPDVTLEVLEALKLYLNIPHLIFVVGIDRAVVDGVVRKHYEKHGLGVEKARHYLDKIFQVEVAIAPSQTQVEGGYFDEQIKKLNERTGGYWDDMLSGNGHKKPIENTLLKIAGNNPREIKRLLNSTLHSGREAAERKNLGDDEKLLFAQGAQVYLLLRYVQSMLEPPLTANNLLVSRSNVQRLAAISEHLQDHDPNSPPGSLEAGEAAFKKLLENTPEDDARKKLNPTIFQQPELQELLGLIPFSVDVAQAAAEASLLTPTPTPSPTPPPGPSAELVLEELPDALAKKLEGVDPSKVASLNLSGSGIVDDDLAYLKPLTQLRVLILSSTQVSNAGLEHLKPLTQLRALHLTCTQVNDAGLEHLKPLAQLQWLSLNGTQVSDAGLGHLKPLTQLLELWLGETKVTEAGADELKKHLPNCNIYWRPR